MDLSTLRDSFRKLGLAFGLSEARVDRQCDTCKNLFIARFSDRQMMKATEYILMNADRFPTVRAIMDVCRMYEEKAAGDKSLCVHCGSTGHAMASMVDTGKKYRAIFNCPYCNNSRFNYPKWSRHKFPGYVLDSGDIPWDASDTYQVKGLAKQGIHSLAWKMAPQELRDAATAYMETKGRSNKSKRPETDGFTKAESLVADAVESSVAQRTSSGYDNGPLI